ncbi:hypothetical protein [Lactococcus termiticola]|uniref:Uncharacterized protein n=1 Tax=Lactococcus termiticola TaxID=2169526 RepID=A0A2R5HG31_9LACT|nr:hypothetical protein [Lactococcus termiticola]GBG96974.1 hypothetical protein NtB2_01111 [Lactococcus termiticola]
MIRQQFYFFMIGVIIYAALLYWAASHDFWLPTAFFAYLLGRRVVFAYRVDRFNRMNQPK